jgi:2',3'-cyclic-nucleotide 2'-phosphodiesterase (5'-nucleotidase family)
LSITVQSNQGKAEYQRALQQAAQIRRLAEAESEKIARIGIAQAIATEEQVQAYGGPQYQVTQQVLNRFAEAIEQARVDVLVPRVMVGGGGEEGGMGSNNLMQDC